MGWPSMVSKQNLPHGLDGLWAVVDSRDDGLIVLEGRPAVFESREFAERAARRTSRPAFARVHQVKHLVLDGGRHWDPAATPAGARVTPKADLVVIPAPGRDPE